jgi:hypothetical protein
MSQRDYYRNDATQRDEAQDTYLSRAENELRPSGRFGAAGLTKQSITGATPMPQYPASSSNQIWSGDEQRVEEPIGYDISAAPDIGYPPTASSPVAVDGEAATGTAGEQLIPVVADPTPDPSVPVPAGELAPPASQPATATGGAFSQSKMRRPA